MINFKFISKKTTENKINITIIIEGFFIFQFGKRIGELLYYTTN
jgi:hypothetical protein